MAIGQGFLPPDTVGEVGPNHYVQMVNSAFRIYNKTGTPLIPLNRPVGSPARVAFDQLVLKMNPDEVGRYWIDRKIRGQTGAPKAIPSLELLRRAVASVAGTLTYLSASELTADLMIVNVDGKRPTEAGYPLSPA